MTLPNLNAAQERNARAVAQHVFSNGVLTRTAFPLILRVIRLSLLVCLTESSLYMYANSFNPESLQLPHDKVGSDHGSVGLYQQQVTGAPHSTGAWGTTAELMDIKRSTDKFLAALTRNSHYMDWLYQRSPLLGAAAPSDWLMAQYVQSSQYSDGQNYKLNYPLAFETTDYIWNDLPTKHPIIRTYEVKSGDTLSKIARGFVLTWPWVTVNSLTAINDLADPNLINVGDVLWIG